MKHNDFLPPPVRLSQAFDGETCGGGRISRRTFIKRTGGATVATMIAWNMTAARARADGESGSGSVSGSYMCAIGPMAAYDNIIGYYGFSGGGYVMLYHADTACYQQTIQCHHTKHIGSNARILAKATIPSKDDPDTPWVFKVPLDEAEANSFDLSAGGITRTQLNVMHPWTHTRELEEDPQLLFKLQIVEVVRTNYSVEIFAKAWLEGAAGGETYSSWQYADGSGLSMVIENAQEAHAPANCEVQP